VKHILLDSARENRSEVNQAVLNRGFGWIRDVGVALAGTPPSFSALPDSALTSKPLS
jgi:hypothetical protein